MSVAPLLATLARLLLLKNLSASVGCVALCFCCCIDLGAMEVEAQ